ncbi:MAG: VOC family protein [Maritimibacter sp.]
MQPIPYIFFKNQARDAFTFWAEVFGVDAPEIMDGTQMPDSDRIPGMAPETVMHAALKIGSGWIYGSDDPSDGEGPVMSGCNVYVDLPTFEEAKRVFDALSEGGEVRMPFEATFWSPGFGTLSDKFGVRWMVSITDEAG